MYIYQKSGNTRLLVIERNRRNQENRPHGSPKMEGFQMMKVNVELPEVLPVNKEDFMKLLLDLVVKK